MTEAKIRITAKDDTAAATKTAAANFATLERTALSMTGVLAGLFGGLSLAGLGSFIKGVNDSVDALNDVRDAVGTTIENLSALEDIGARTGTSFESVSTSLIKFNDALSKSKSGSDTAAVFARLNLDIAELKRLDPSEALRRTAVALAGFADDGNKARLVQELFGRSVREVAPFLKNLAEQGGLVATATTRQAEEAEKFNRELFTMKKNVDDLARKLTNGLVVSLNDVTRTFREADKAGQSFLGTAFSRYLANVKDFYRDMGLIDGKVSGDGSGAGLAALTGNPFIGRGNAGRGTVNPEFVRPSVAEATAGGKSSTRKAVQDNTAVRDAVSDLDRYSQSLLAAIERTKDLSAVETARLRISESGGLGFSEAKRAYVLGLAEQLDAIKATAEQEKALADIRARAEALSTRRLDSMLAENDAIVGSNQVLRQQLEEIGLTTIELDRLRLSRLDDAIATEKQTLATAQNIEGNELEIAQIERRIRLKQAERDLVSGATTKRVEVDAAAEDKKRTDRLADSIEQGILTGFRDGGRAADLFIDELKAQFAKTVLRPLIQPVAEAGNKLISAGIGSLFKSFGLPSFDGGGSTGGGARAGGVDGKGGFLSVLHPNETVVDHSKGQRAGGGVTIVLNQTVGDVATLSMLRKNNAQMVHQIHSGLRRTMEYGGAYS